MRGFLRIWSFSTSIEVEAFENEAVQFQNEATPNWPKKLSTNLTGQHYVLANFKPRWVCPIAL